MKREKWVERLTLGGCCESDIVKVRLPVEFYYDEEGSLAGVGFGLEGVRLSREEALLLQRVACSVCGDECEDRYGLKKEKRARIPKVILEAFKDKEKESK